MTTPPLPEDMAKLVAELRGYAKALTSSDYLLAACSETMHLAATAIETLSAQSVPEGWKLVPVEPTQEMLDAVTPEGIPGWRTYQHDCKQLWKGGPMTNPTLPDDMAKLVAELRLYDDGLPGSSIPLAFHRPHSEGERVMALPYADLPRCCDCVHRQVYEWRDGFLDEILNRKRSRFVCTQGRPVFDCHGVEFNTDPTQMRLTGPCGPSGNLFQPSAAALKDHNP